MKLGTKIPKRTSKKTVIAHPESIKEANKFFKMFYARNQAAELLGVTKMTIWNMASGHTKIMPDMANKMVELSGGKVSYEKLMMRPEKKIKNIVKK